jgi:hypothetical protein
MRQKDWRYEVWPNVNGAGWVVSIYNPDNQLSVENATYPDLATAVSDAQDHVRQLHCAMTSKHPASPRAAAAGQRQQRRSWRTN